MCKRSCGWGLDAQHQEFHHGLVAWGQYLDNKLSLQSFLHVPSDLPGSTQLTTEVARPQSVIWAPLRLVFPKPDTGTQILRKTRETQNSETRKTLKNFRFP